MRGGISRSSFGAAWRRRARSVNPLRTLTGPSPRTSHARGASTPLALPARASARTRSTRPSAVRRDFSVVSSSRSFPSENSGSRPTTNQRSPAPTMVSGGFVMQGRTVLQHIVKGRLKFHPRADGEGYHFTADTRLDLSSPSLSRSTARGEGWSRLKPALHLL